MPTETWENILFQAQLVLHQLVTNRTPEELLTLVDNVDRVHADGRFRTTALHRPLWLVR